MKLNEFNRTMDEDVLVERLTEVGVPLNTEVKILDTLSVGLAPSSHRYLHYVKVFTVCEPKYLRATPQAWQLAEGRKGNVVWTLIASDATGSTYCRAQ